MDTYAVKITKVPGGAKAALSDGEATIEELFSEVFGGENIAKYQIQVDGNTVNKDYVPEDGENVTVAKQIKGN